MKFINIYGKYVNSNIVKRWYEDYKKRCEFMIENDIFADTLYDHYQTVSSQKENAEYNIYNYYIRTIENLDTGDFGEYTILNCTQSTFNVAFDYIKNGTHYFEYITYKNHYKFIIKEN